MKMAKPVWTNQQIINQLDSGLKWSGQSLTYGFPTTGGWFPYAEKTGASGLTASQKDAFTLAIRLWDDLISPDFSLAANGATANIKAMNTTTAISYAHGYFPGGSVASGSLWFNPGYDASSGTNDLVTPKVGRWGFSTYLHELGHTLGLDHPGEYDGGSPTYANDALYVQDSEMYTLMSYFDAGNTGADWVASDGRSYFAQAPMLHDIMAIQAIYGAETTTRTGNTTYGFNSNADVWVYDFSQNTHPVLCIYDSGGLDTLDLSGWNYACTIDLTPGAYSSSDMMKYNLSISFGTVIENGIGGGGADILTGNSSANSLSGLAGADILDGGAGNDALLGGEGSDELRGGAGNDKLYGGAGADKALFAGAFATYGILWDEAQAAFILTHTASGSADGADTIFDVESFAFADMTLTAAALLAAAETGGGSGTGGDDEVIEPPAPLVITGTSASDDLVGGALADRLTGLGGDDYLDGRAGADILTGGAGNDAYVVDEVGDIVSETGGSGIDLVTASVDFSLADTMRVKGSVENLTLLGSAGTAIGNALKNILVGTAGENILNGLAGADTMRGGGGNDTYVVDNASDFIDEAEGTGVDTVLSSVAFNLADASRVLGGVENLTLTGKAAIAGTGNGLANVIMGNEGGNVLAGLGGADTLVGGGGRDFASYAASDAAVSVSLTTGAVAGGHASGDVLGEIENVTGSAFDDVLEGDGGANVLVGGANGPGGDTVTYANASAGVVVALSKTTAQNTLGAGTDKLSGFENLTGSGFDDALTGSAGANILEGGAGNDVLNGGKGNDRICGGQGSDRLTGGAGEDTFVFASPLHGIDVVTDFRSGTDHLEISAAGFAGGLTAGAAANLLAVTSLSESALADGLATFIFERAGSAAGTLYWDATGGSLDDAVALASISTAIIAADLLVV
jgi:serralysin